MEYWAILLSVAIGTLGINYLFRNFNFFKRHGIIHVPSVPILGSMTSLVFRRISFGDFLQKLYNFKEDAKYVGFYATTQPVLLFRDPELVKEAFVKNFEAFPNRLGFTDFNDPLFAKNLFSLHGQKWRDTRSLLSPTFTSSKMKTMFALMAECAEDFTNFLSTLPADKRDMDMKESFARYTNDVIATCAFGIKIDSMKDPTNKFYVYGKEATTFVGLRVDKLFFLRTFPTLARILGVRMSSENITNFFKNAISTTIATRDSENITRPDMIQLMMDIRGKWEAERELSIEDMTAQAFVFFLAGYETSSTAMCFMAHEIATNPDIQAKLQQEIDGVLEEFNGEVTYEAINRLEYLDAVVNEALRLYPPTLFIERVCDRTYELPPALPDEKSIILKKGMLVWVPIYAIHRDKKYYDDPNEFRPERFLNNKTHHNAPYYIPFGTGPRMCIANRFALLEIKILLFHLLARCELKPCARTTLPMKLSKKSLRIMAEGRFWLNIQPRSSMHPAVRSITINGAANS